MLQGVNHAVAPGRVKGQWRVGRAQPDVAHFRGFHAGAGEKQVFAVTRRVNIEVIDLVVLAVDGAEIRGIGELFNLPLERADVGLVVEDGFQGRGIGRELLQTLIQVARKQGIRALTGDMAYGNERAVALLRGTGRQLQLRVGGGGVQFSLLLQA